MGFIDRIVSRSSKYSLGDDDRPSKADQRSPVEERLLARLHQASDQSNLTGWVRNNSDGSVEMEIQGPPAAIAAHLDAVHAYYRRFNNRIWLDEEQDRTPQTDSKEFEVRY